ncbi:polymeric immunoglobulin receptor-like [Brachyhypopomus gauderio]|uniref:polymeric immunoglobulin receptor-like n=1 Tax=Brachyhypopomus gauderio TaxID=698409 RepID=UPI0040428474
MEEQKKVDLKHQRFLAESSPMAPSRCRSKSLSHTSGSTETAHCEFHTVRVSAGDDVRLPCHLPPEIRAAAREIRWWKETDCVYLCQVTVGRGYEGRVELVESPGVPHFEDVSLILKDVKVTDSGQYNCEILTEKKQEISVIHLHVSEILGTESSSMAPSCCAHPEVHTVRVSVGENATLPYHLPPEIRAVAREIRWWKETDCVYLCQVTVGRGYEGRVELGECSWMCYNRNESLILRDVKVTDSGQYKCEILTEEKKETSVIHLHVSEFKLVSTWDDVKHTGSPPESCRSSWLSCQRSWETFCGDDATLQCYLSPETSAVSMEIRWFKGTDCVYLYLNGQVTEGRGYEGRVSLITHELQRGNVSLALRDVQESDGGHYKCKITHGENTVEKGFYLFVSELKLVSYFKHVGSVYDFTPYSVRFGHMTERADPRPATVHACAGDDIILPGLLNPETSAVSMEIRWFKGTDCVYLYLNGQVTEGRGYEGRVSLITHELQTGNVSLTLRDVQESDGGDYRCEVTCGKLTLTNSGVHLQISEYRLVHRSEDVGKPSVFKDGSRSELSLSSHNLISASLGGDATMPCYLSPETSTISLEIRWFKGTDCVYLYLNGQVTEGRGYEGRVSLITHELQRGNVSLTLRDVQESDEGVYRCEVTTGDETVETSVDLICRSYSPIPINIDVWEVEELEDSLTCTLPILS